MYFYDSYALIEMFEGGPNYKKFEEGIVYTSIMNLYEFYYAVLKNFNEETAKYWDKKLNSVLIEITKKDILNASKFRLINIKKKMSFIDCLGYILALKNNMKFLTGDSKFEGLKNVEFVK